MTTPTTATRKTRLPSGVTEASVYNNRYRTKRMQDFLVLADAVLARKGVCRVLDVGGWKSYWVGLEGVWGDRNLEITLINLDPPAVGEGRFSYLQGDARDLSQFKDNHFDVVHSNSVIEHVGQWGDMKRMANEIRRVAPAYYVQTPNFWFPLEPHLRTPFIHWLPHPLQRRIVMARDSGFHPKALDVDTARDILSDANLLDARSMEALFPDAEILRERAGPFVKSLIAVRRAPTAA